MTDNDKAVEQLLDTALRQFSEGHAPSPTPNQPPPRDPFDWNNCDTLQVILDASASMLPWTKVTVDSLCAMLDHIRMRTGNVLTTVTPFDERRLNNLAYQIPIDYIDRNLLRAQYSPNGGTALYDTIMAVTGSMLLDRRPGKRIVVIQSDGEDLDSYRNGYHDVDRRVRKLRDMGWEVIFLGGASTESEQADLARQGERIGIKPENLLTYNMSSIDGMRELGDNIGKFLTGQRSNVGFDDVQRRLAGEVRRYTYKLNYKPAPQITGPSASAGALPPKKD